MCLIAFIGVATFSFSTLKRSLSKQDLQPSEPKRHDLFEGCYDSTDFYLGVTRLERFTTIVLA
jgi:hypothetical protein